MNTRLTKLTKGYAENSVNATSFRKNAITTGYFEDGKVQYAAYYDAVGEVVLARRVNDASWETFNTGLKANISDAHNVISVGVDGNGCVHLAWSDHAGRMTYAKSANSHTAKAALTFEETTMLGSLEESVTYPEFYNLSNGDLLFLYRDGSSGNGNLVLNRYAIKEKSWIRLQDNLISGENRLSPYWQAVVDSKDRLHISWVWRETPDVKTNFNMNYAVSADDTFKKFQKSDGEKYSLPITEATCEVIKEIPQGSALINQTSMTVDDEDVPYIASYWRENGAVQYHILHFNGKEWKCENTNLRKTDFELSSVGTKKIPIARPQILVQGAGNDTKVKLLIRDEERGSRVSAAEFVSVDVFRLDEYCDITDFEVGVWEPNFDINLWKKEKKINVLLQNCFYSPDETKQSVNRAEDVYVLEIER